MFVDKIMQNRKRMEYTIKRFEEKEKERLADALTPLPEKPHNKKTTPNTAVDAS